MQVRLLGPVELWGVDGQVDLGAPQQRCVFSVLAMAPRQAVSVETLVDRIWGEQVPRHVRTVLYTYVSRLRGLLRRAGGGTGAGAVLRRRDGGYALEVDPDLVDLHHARQLATRARALAGDGPGAAGRAADLLAEACELWSGAPLAGVTGDWADRVRVGLDHERLALLAERFDAALRAGRHDSVIGPLSEALATYPLTESLASLLMLALHRCGRHAESLEVYGQLRRRMVEELGAEPGPELRRMHERILRRDPGLGDGQPPARTGGAPGWVPLCQLPPDIRHLVGREALLEELTATLAPAGTAVPAVAMTGPPGVGKTALATRLAHLLRARFPDGQWYARLGGAQRPRDPADVAAELLEASGADRDAIPEGLARRTAALRARMADRQVLLLLDDAADATQVRPLLPGTAAAAVIVTGQRTLAGLAEAANVRIDPLPPQAGVELLRRTAGTERVAAAPEAAQEIHAACGGLPLALRIAGARLVAHPEWTVDRLATRLRDRRRRLDELTVDDLTVRPGLEQAYLALEPTLRAALRRLATLGHTEFTAPAAAGLVAASGHDPPGGHAGPGSHGGHRDHLVEWVLDGLVTANLLDIAGADPTGEPRYRLPELVAAYAAERAEPDGAAAVTVARRHLVAVPPDSGPRPARPGAAAPRKRAA